MASLHNRKRRISDDSNNDNATAKRTKFSAAQNTSNHPPKFWDNLSKIWLTPRALRELDRRNDTNPSTISTATSSGVTATTLARFARRGGPDLRHLRGCPEPSHPARMSSERSIASSSRPTLSTKATSVSSRAKRSSAYDKDFEQNLIDHSIYPEGYEYADDRTTPEPNNLDDIVQGLSNPRASLSPSRFPAAAYKGFKQANSRVISEGKVMADILPIIRGNASFPNEGNLPFTNLDSITDGTTVDAVPDLYDGSYPKDINKVVRQDLNKTVIPTSHGRAPAAPNFFVEAKAPRGGADVAKRQACLDGAVGARAMHSLYNYGEDEPIYDGNAHAFSATYHDGTLKMYAHHMTAPTADGGLPEYHMTQLDGWQMTGNIETFKRGAAAFRNARDMAQHHRETNIQAANTRAMQATTTRNADETGEHNIIRVPVAHDGNPGWQKSDDDLQQQIADSLLESPDIFAVTSTTPKQQDSSDESQEQCKNLATVAIDDPFMSFTSSFTSSFSADAARPKRSRQSFSSPTQGSRSSKSRSRSIVTRRPLMSPTTTAESNPPRRTERHWVEPFDYNDKIVFRNLEGTIVKTKLTDWEEEMIDGTKCWYWRDVEADEIFWTKELHKVLPEEAEKQSDSCFLW